MSALTTAQVQKIAKLARIRLSDDEVVHYGNEISVILNWIEMLQEVNTDKVTRMSSVSSVGLSLREDKVTDGNIQESIISNAPKSAFGCFEVPKVVE